MSRPLTVDQESRWVARSPVPSGDTAEQLAIIDDLLQHFDHVCRLAWRLNATRFAMTLESDRLAARQMRRRLAKRTEIAR